MVAETLALGRAKRSTAGNRMRELLEKAHQEDEKDELFAEEADDDEFEAPQDVRDVFLDEFADTDDEVEMDEEAEEREIRREERRKAKGKGKSVYNPLAAPRAPVQPKQARFADPSSSSPAPETSQAADLALLDPSLDPYAMAPTTLALTIRRQRREAKRAQRNELRRSTMRASTLRTEAEVIEKEIYAKLNPGKKGRRAQHETGEVRGKRNMTQDQLIAAALEEEERNKEALRDWIRREEERRELRRVGRKRVRGPRWSWVSRTVGKLVEAVEEEKEPRRLGLSETPQAAEKGPTADLALKPVVEGGSTEEAGGETFKKDEVDINQPEAVESSVTAPIAPQSSMSGNPGINPSTEKTRQTSDTNADSTVTVAPTIPEPVAEEGPTGPYMRNYIILSQIPGGLPAELRVVLGDHVEWDQVKVIPARNRPINRRPQICPFTGQIAKYRHPITMTPYADVEGYKQIEALLQHRYVWSDEGRCWFGGEEDVYAEGIEELAAWNESVNWGWCAGKEIVGAVEEVEANVEDEGGNATTEMAIDDAKTRGKGKRKSESHLTAPSKKKPKSGGKGRKSIL